MEKTIVLWTKQWYYTENYGTSINDLKKMVDYQKLRNFDLKWNKKTIVIYHFFLTNLKLCNFDLL